MSHDIDLGLGVTSLPVLLSGAGGFPFPTEHQWDASDSDSYDSVTGGIDNWGSGLAKITQAASGQRPNIVTAGLNGLDTLRFTAANNDYLSVPGTTTLFSPGTPSYWSFFMVVKLHTSVQDTRLFSMVSPITPVSAVTETDRNNDWQEPDAFYVVDYLFGLGVLGDISMRAGFSTSQITSGDVRGGFRLLEFHVTPSRWRGYLDGILIEDKVAADKTIAPNRFCIGAGYLDGGAGTPHANNIDTATCSDIEVAECVLVPREPSDGGINAGRGYFNTKWFPASPFAYLP